MSAFEYKIVLLGSPCVGKSTYINKLITGDFDTCYRATNGVDISQVNMETTSGNVKLNILDFAGQEMYCSHSYRKGHYFGVDAVIVMCDLISKMSFTNSRYFVQEVQKFFEDKVPCFLVANKSDCVDASIKITDKMMQTECRKQKYCDVIKISTKTGEKIKQPLLSIIRLLKEDEKIDIIV